MELPYNTMFRVVRRLRENIYLTTSTQSLKGIVELDEVYVVAGLKGKRSLRKGPRVRGLKRRGRGHTPWISPPSLGWLSVKGCEAYPLHG